MDFKISKTFPGGRGTARERLLLLAAVVLSTVLSLGILGLSFSQKRESIQRQKLAESGFLAAFLTVSEMTSPMDTALACERASMLLEGCAESGIHYELWHNLVNGMQKKAIEGQKGEDGIKEAVVRISEKINSSFRSGKDSHAVLRDADAALCSLMVEKKMSQAKHSVASVWQRLPIGRRNFQQKLLNRTASYLGTSAGMEEAVQAVDLSAHVMYCQNAFVIFRLRGDNFVNIVSCKRASGEDDSFDLEKTSRTYHLPMVEFTEVKQYVEEGVAACEYTSREGLRLHLVKDLVSGKISVVSLVS